MNLPDGMSYEGEVNADGQPHGYGVMTWPNGERHEGKFSKGAPSRRVRLIGHTQVTAGSLPETVSGSEPLEPRAGPASVIRRAERCPAARVSVGAETERT